LPLKFPLFCEAVAKPLPVTVTCAVEVVVPLGTYRTAMVQVLPVVGVSTVVEVQVPPVIEKVPGPTVLVIVGLAEKLNEPAFAPVAVLVTVMVPFFVVVFGATVVNSGLGAENVRVASLVVVGDVTVKFTEPLVPFGVVTVTVLVPVAAVEAIVKVASTTVLLTAPMPLTVIPLPDTVTAYAPVRFVPLRATFTIVGCVAVPCAPEFGLIEVSVGPAEVLRPAWVSTAP
jgi:hypothetical protein